MVDCLLPNSMINNVKMAKTESQVRVEERVTVSVDNNNNKCSGDAADANCGKYQLRPRSLRARRRCDPDWNLQDAMDHKPRAPPLSRYRRKTANARERCRMRQINNAFESLRGVLPSWVCRRRAAADMTKIATLRLASAYIRSLQDMLDGNAPQDTCAWVLSGVFGEEPEPQTPEVTPVGADGVPSKMQPEQQPDIAQDTDLLTLLYGAEEATVLHDGFESSPYLGGGESDQDTVTLLLLGADPPRCWGEAQHTPPVS